MHSVGMRVERRSADPVPSLTPSPRSAVGNPSQSLPTGISIAVASVSGALRALETPLDHFTENGPPGPFLPA
jgi:hypothetical protein